MGFNGGAGFVGRAFGGIAARNGATLNGNSISSVAARAPGTSGTIAGDIADRSLGNYMPQMQGFQLQGTQITGGHISTTAVSADGKSASVDMFNASQFEKPEVPHSVVTAADGSQWYQMASGEGRGAFYDVPTFHGVGADIPNTAAGDGAFGASQPGESGQNFGETLTHDGIEGHPGMVTYPGAADGIGAADTPAPEPWCVPLGLTLLIYILLRSVFLIGYVPSASMEPTLPEGSFILGLRLYSEPKVGDIIIFEKDGVLLVKRIAACPGDSVDLSQLEYMTSIPIPVQEETVLTVPEGCYFVLGDNAQNSRDSRYWEQPFVSGQQIVAKMIVIA